MSFSKSTEYQPVDQREQEVELSGFTYLSRRQGKACSLLNLVGKIVALVACFALGVGYQRFTSSRTSSGIEILWAPELVQQLPTKPTRFGGAFNFTNNFRGPPSPEIDAAWERYDFNPMLRVSAEDINTAVRGEEGYLDTVIALEGGGYLGTMEVFHQLHCLNMLRKNSYHDYYKEKGKYGEQPDDIRRTHLDHCIEILRQVISCNSDTGLIAFHWVEGNANPYPDLNTWHQCRDPEIALQWSLEKQSQNRIDPIKGVVKPPGAVQLKDDP